MGRGKKKNGQREPCFEDEAWLIECIASSILAATEKMRKRKVKKGTTETQRKRDTVLQAMLFVTVLLKELLSRIPAHRKKNGLIRYSYKTKYKDLDMPGEPFFDEKHWEAYQSLKDPNNSIHPIIGTLSCGGRPTLYTSVLLLPVVGGICGAVIGHWKASKALNNAGIHKGIIGIMQWLFITTLIAELLDALCIASPIAPYVNSIVKPMDQMSKVLELRMAVTWYFRLRPGAADDIAKALGWDTTDGTLEAFLLGLGKLDLDMDKTNAKVSNSAV